jgi:SecD/SecF fusion protein
MESNRYIIGILSIAAFLFCSHIPPAEIKTYQKTSFGFFETYSLTEVLSNLDPDDKFFQWVDTEGADETGCRLGSCQEANASALWEHIHGTVFQEQLPGDILFAWGASAKSGTKVLYALKEQGGKRKYPDSSHIQEVSIRENAQGDSYELLISFNDEGAKYWAELTGANVDRNLAIVFNELVYSAPMVREAIKEGKCVISGNFSESDLNIIKSVLEE